jgi:hypothetical protein
MDLISSYKETYKTINIKGQYIAQYIRGAYITIVY